MGRTALIVVDMLSSYDFEDAEKLIPAVEEALPRMAELRERAIDEGAPTIYVNDNYGDWHSNRDALLRAATEGEHVELVEPIAPSDDSLFIFKARHSIFFQTPLEYLLGQQDVDRVVLVGQVTEQCILYSALDAYIRHLEVCVPRDAVASIHPHLAEAALELMERNMGADVCDAADVEFGDR
jgi:nicotinamidase-related amidase